MPRIMIHIFSPITVIGTEDDKTIPVIELYKGVCKREKWVGYLLQHFNKKSHTQTEIESLIHWM
jgi:hypothetical protein